MVGKGKRKPFNKGKRPEHPFDEVSTDTTRPISPPDIEGNVILQLFFDGTTGHIQGPGNPGFQ